MSDSFGLGIVIVAGVFFVLGIITGAGICSEGYREEAIERGFAEYHSTTGKWQWKEQNNE